MEKTEEQQSQLWADMRDDLMEEMRREIKEELMAELRRELVAEVKTELFKDMVQAMMRAACNKKAPQESIFQRWETGSFSQIAMNKEGDMSVTFRMVLEEFPEKLKSFGTAFV